MKVFEVTRILQDWVKEHSSHIPGYRAAHLIGSITHMVAGAVYPYYDQIHVSVILENDSDKPKTNLIIYQGISIVCSYRFCHEYSLESVLSHPELTAHLVAESVLDDPQGFLTSLQRQIRRRYDLPQWIQARCEFEYRSLLVMLERMDDLPDAVTQTSAFLSALNFLAGMVAAAHMQPASSRLGFVVMKILFQKMSLTSIHEHVLEMAGFAHMTRYQVETYLADAATLFDKALQTGQAPHAFDQYLHAHLRPLLVDGAFEMIRSGSHREAMIWIAAFYLNCWDVIARDGDEATRATFGPRVRTFLNDMGLASRANRKDRSDLVRVFAQEIFTILMSDVVMIGQNSHHASV